MLRTREEITEFGDLGLCEECFQFMIPGFRGLFYHEEMRQCSEEWLSSPHGWIVNETYSSSSAAVGLLGSCFLGILLHRLGTKNDLTWEDRGR